MLDKSVALFPLDLDSVIEVTSSLSHGQRAYNLADCHPNKSDEEPNLNRLGARDLARKEYMGDQTFNDRRAMGDIVRPAICREEEGGDRSMRRIVESCDVKFEEVEETQRGDEEGHSPERGGEDYASVEAGADGDPGNEAEEVCANGDSGERFLAGWEVRRVD